MNLYSSQNEVCKIHASARRLGEGGLVDVGGFWSVCLSITRDLVQIGNAACY